MRSTLGRYLQSINLFTSCQCSHIFLDNCSIKIDLKCVFSSEMHGKTWVFSIVSLEIIWNILIYRQKIKKCVNINICAFLKRDKNDYIAYSLGPERPEKDFLCIPVGYFEPTNGHTCALVHFRDPKVKGLEPFRKAGGDRTFIRLSQTQHCARRVNNSSSRALTANFRVGRRRSRGEREKKDAYVTQRDEDPSVKKHYSFEISSSFRLEVLYNAAG